MYPIPKGPDINRTAKFRGYGAHHNEKGSGCHPLC